jgi:tetratricopeptide (TPR) repeat protein
LNQAQKSIDNWKVGELPVQAANDPPAPFWVRTLGKGIIATSSFFIRQQISECESRYCRAEWYGFFGELDKALADYTFITERHPELAVVYAMRAKVYTAMNRHPASLADCDEAIRLDPTSLDNLFVRAVCRNKAGDFAGARDDFVELARLKPEDYARLNDFALLLAICPRDDIRNGVQAVEIAQKCCELTAWKNPSILDTLAVAYAEAGQFDEAIRWQKAAVEHPDFPAKYADEARQRLRLFAEGKPWREGMEKPVT